MMAVALRMKMQHAIAMIFPLSNMKVTMVSMCVINNEECVYYETDDIKDVLTTATPTLTAVTLLI